VVVDGRNACSDCMDVSECYQRETARRTLDGANHEHAVGVFGRSLDGIHLYGLRACMLSLQARREAQLARTQTKTGDLRPRSTGAKNRASPAARATGAGLTSGGRMRVRGGRGGKDRASAPPGSACAGKVGRERATERKAWAPGVTSTPPVWIVGPIRRLPAGLSSSFRYRCRQRSA
jgi:hypothetical protein